MSAVASCVEYASFFSIVGVISAVAFTCFGAAYGTAKSGVGIATIGVMRPDLIMKSVIPVVMAGIVAIYGLVISMMILNDIEASMALTKGFMQMGAGVSAGFAGLSSGFAIGVVGDAGVRGSAQQPRLFVGSILILIFAEVLGLYGLIVGLVLYSRSKVDCA